MANQLCKYGMTLRLRALDMAFAMPMLRRASAVIPKLG